MSSSSTSSNRELAAILFADIVDFTALMHHDESIALALRGKYKEIMDRCLSEFHGQYIQYFGDGTLSLFESAWQAVQCAIKIQQELLNDQRVPVRIGIHLGDVLVSNNEVLGDSVNIASRIESFAVSGGVFVSDSVSDMVQNQSEISFQPLGKFQLKNVKRPFEIFAVVHPDLVVPDGNFLVGKGDKLAKLGGLVPKPEHTILGREQEIKDILQLLETNQLVTITGTGGMGKTRLSLEICQRLSGLYGDAMAFISMSTITDVTEVMPTLANALDVHETTGRSAVEGVIDSIGDSKALIILDNLEQVISAAGEITTLTSHCPKLKILCTSRTPLRVAREKEYALHPLAIPQQFDSNPEALMSFASIQLFVERAVQSDDDFKLTERNTEHVAAICRRLDGLPLALELAAARLRVLAPEQLHQRLGQALDILKTSARDVPQRHQTLRTTIQWSHDLLNESEKQLFRQIAVFSGGFRLKALEEICYPDENDRFNAIDELESLIEKGLIERTQDSNSFYLLQTIRDFAWEQLEAMNETDIVQWRHADWYGNFAIYLREGSYGMDQVQRLKEGEFEEANLISALEFLLDCAKKGDESAREKGLLICGEIWMFWHIKGKNVSANDYVNAFLDSTPDLKPTLGKCRALMSSAVAYWITGDFQKSLERAHLQHEMAQKLGVELELVKSLVNLTIAYLMTDIATSLRYSEESVNRAVEIENPYWISTAYYFNGIANMVKGEIETAQKSHLISLEYTEKTGDFESRGGALSGLAATLAAQGRTDESIKQYEESLESFATSGDRAEVARILSEMSWLLIGSGETSRAKNMALESIQVYQEVGSTRGVGISMLGLAAIESLENRPYSAVQIAAAADCYAEQEGIVNDYGYSSQDRSFIDSASNQLNSSEIEDAIHLGSRLSLREVISLMEEEVAILT